jgi:hypothetical protein
MVSIMPIQRPKDRIEPQPSTDESSSEQNLVSTTPRTFDFFPKLPIELRLIVWEMALPASQWLEVFQLSSLASPPGTSTYVWKSSSQNAKAPAILFTSRESRTVALAHYQPLNLPNIERTSYIDPRNDILLCSKPITLDALEQIAQAVPNLARLAMESYDVLDWSDAAGLKWFEDLKELMAFPLTASVPHESFVVEDVDEKADVGAFSMFNYTRLRRIEKVWQNEDGNTEGWMAPKLRICKFVELE